MTGAATDIVILGAGRGSAELVDLLAGSSFRPVAVLDDRWNEGLAPVSGVAVTGALSDAAAEVARGRRLLLGVANARRPSVRADIDHRLALADPAWATFAHRDTTVARSATVGPGCILYPGVRVATSASLARQVVVYFNAVIHHDAVLGTGVTVCAGVLVSGGVRVGDGAYLGAGCILRDGVSVGRNALVGMGAVVTRDVADGATVAGVPARAIERRGALNS